MLAFLADTKIGRAIAALGGLLIAGLGIFAMGWSKRGASDTAAKAQAEVSTLKQVDKLQSDARSSSDEALADSLTRHD